MKYKLEEFHRNIADKELLDDMNRVAMKLDRSTVTTRQYAEHGKFSFQTIMLRFGSWRKALEKTGLKGTRQQMNRTVADEELFKNIESVWAKLGRQPKWRDIQQKNISNIGGGPYIRSFGSWRKALESFIEYANREENVSSEQAIKNLALEPVTKHKTLRDINWRLRFIVMRRDNFKCKCCGRSPATDTSVILHVDHKQAWTNGGETVLENLQTLCSKCNIGKSNLKIVED